MIERWLWPDSRVTRVVDGDTFVAEVHRDLGFHGTTTFSVRLRLNRINAPALSTVAGKASKVFAESLLLGRPLLIETVGPYKYRDEWMAEVGNGYVSDYMVTSGHAVYWDGQGPRPGDG